ncbi:MAG TPA: LamG domain-containing protein [Planctomycetota bacterium]|nr:LamG domain-containing protein [Planctomycetota bacterium]
MRTPAIALLLLAIGAAADGATITWNSAVLANWGDGANWVGGSVPGPADTARFDVPAGDCAIDVDVDVAGVSITGSYGGTIAQAATSSLRIGSAGWSQLNGSFAGAAATTIDAAIDISGAFALTNGTFTSTRARLLVGGDFTVGAGGAFVHNSGTVLLKSAVDRTLDCSDAFHDLVFNDGLIGHWRGEEAAGPSGDSSGYAHDATWNGGVARDAAVKPALDIDNAGALNFDPTDGGDYLSISDRPEFKPAAITMAAWQYVPTGADWVNTVNLCPIFNRAEPNPSTVGYVLQGALVPGEMIFRFQTDAGYNTLFFSGVTRDTWHHVAVTYAGTSASGFLDGALVTTVASPGSTTLVHGATADVRIGRSSRFGFAYLHAKLDDIRVYDRALDENAIRRLASGRNPSTSIATVTLASSLFVDNDLTIASGEVDFATHNATIAGSYRCLGGDTQPGSSIIYLSASGSESLIAGDEELNRVDVYGSGTVTFADTVRLDGGYWQNAGVVNAAATRLEIGGGVTLDGGTLTASSGTTTIAGAVAVAGAATFAANSGTVELLAAGSPSVAFDAPLDDLVVRGGADDGLVCHLRFDELAGATVYDAVSDSAAGKFGLEPLEGAMPYTMNRPVPSAVVAPIAGGNRRSLDFDPDPDGNGVADGKPHIDHVRLVVDSDDLNDPLALQLATVTEADYSLAAWVKPDRTPIGSGTDALGCGAILMKEGNHIGLVYGENGYFGITHFHADGSDTSVFTPVAYDIPGSVASRWFHLCATVDLDPAGGTVRLYLDGELQGSGAIAAGKSPQIFGPAVPWRIGCGRPDASGGAYGWLFDGKIDDVRIYSRALSAGEARILAGGWAPGRSVAGRHQMAGTLDVDGDLTLISGGLAATTFDATVAGSWRNFGAELVPGTRRVTFAGAGLGNVIRSGSWPFHALSVTGAGTWTLEDALSCRDELTIATGTLDVSGDDHAVTAATLLQPTGAFQARAGTLSLDTASDRPLTAASSLHRLRLASAADSALVGCWPLDESSGDVIADHSGQRNHGVRIGADPAAAASAPGPSFANAGSYAFTAADSDYIEIADLDDDFDLDPAQTLTIAAWVRPSALSSWRGIVSKGGNLLFYNGGGNASALSFWYKRADNDQDVGIDSLGVLVPGQWQHVAVTHTIGTPTAIRFYRNGIDVTDTGFAWQWGAGNEAAKTGGNSPFHIGVGNLGAGEHFDGRIDDVRYYDRVLSAAEIQRLAAGRLAAASLAGATWTLTRALDIDQDIFIDGGALSPIGSSVTLAGDWHNAVGASGFVAGTSTVTLDGMTQALSGSTTFTNLTKTTAAPDSLAFPVGEVQTVTGMMTLTGTDAVNRLSIVSSSPGTTASISPVGGRTCSWLSVRDSRNLVHPPIEPADSVDAGNTRWWFDGNARGALGGGYPAIY